MGIDLDEFGDLGAAGKKPKKPGMGASATLAVKRAVIDLALSKEKRRVEPAHLLLALLRRGKARCRGCLRRSMSTGRL